MPCFLALLSDAESDAVDRTGGCEKLIVVISVTDVGVEEGALTIIEEN